MLSASRFKNARVLFINAALKVEIVKYYVLFQLP